MKLITVAFVLMFMVKNIVAESDDSSKSHNLQSGKVNINTSLTSLQDKAVPNKTKKFIVSLKKPTKTSFHLPQRGHINNHAPKFQIQHNVLKRKTVPVPSTRRPKLMQAKKFTSKPHAIDQAEELVVRSNFNKKNTQSKFNLFRNEEKHKVAEKNNYKTEHLENRFQNFTDIGILNENESQEIEKPFPRRYMKTAASDKIKAIASPPLTDMNTKKNYKIKELLKNQKYNPRLEKKFVPVLALQKASGVLSGGQQLTTTSKNLEGSSTTKNNLCLEEKNDQNTSTTTSPDDEKLTTDSIILT